MDLLLLGIVRKILKWNSKWSRILLAAIIGSVAACFFAIIPELFGVVKFLIIYIFICPIMIRVAFCVKKMIDLLKGAIVLYITAFCLGGVIHSLYYQRKMISYYMDLLEDKIFNAVSIQFLLGAGILAVIIIMLSIGVLRKHNQFQKEIYQVSLTWDQASIEAKGLVDTGNCLFDPITGRPVIVVEMRLMRECFSPTLYEDIKNIMKLEDTNYHISPENITKIRLIPFQSIGKKRGILPAIILDEIIIQKDSHKICSKHVVAAIYDDILSQRNEYQVILHKSLI